MPSFDSQRLHALIGVISDSVAGILGPSKLRATGPTRRPAGDQQGTGGMVE